MERLYRRLLITLDPGMSLNCPPGHVAHGRGATSRALLATSRAQRVVRLYRISLNMVMKMVALAQTSAPP